MHAGVSLRALPPLPSGVQGRAPWALADGRRDLGGWRKRSRAPVRDAPQHAARRPTLGRERPQWAMAFVAQDAGRQRDTARTHGREERSRFQVTSRLLRHPEGVLTRGETRGRRPKSTATSRKSRRLDAACEAEPQPRNRSDRCLLQNGIRDTETGLTFKYTSLKGSFPRDFRSVHPERGLSFRVFISQ